MNPKVEDAEVVTSPVPNRPVVANKPPVELSFPDAVREILNGRTVTRLSWGSNEEYGFFHDDYLSIHTKGETHRWLVNSGDLNGIDWVVLPL